MKISKNVLLVAMVTSALAFVGMRVLADDAADIQQDHNYQAVIYNGAGDDADGGNDADVIVDQILSQPGTYGGHTYTGWAISAADASGSLDIFATASSLSTLGWTPAVGQNISVSATYNPYHSIPEIASPSAVTVISTGNATWAQPGIQGGSAVTTIPAVLANTGSNTYLPLTQGLEDYLVEIRDVTISGARTLTAFPATNDGNLFLNDTAGHQLTLYFYYSSYSCDGAMTGAPIPDNSPLTSAGLFDVWGLLSAYPSVSGGVTNWQDELVPTAFVAEVPEPSSIMLAGIGLLSLLAVIRRRHS